MAFQIKQETITIYFNLDQNEVFLESKRDKYMKDIIEQYLKIIQKDHINCVFLCDGSKLNEELKIDEIINKGYEIRILVIEIENDDNKKCEEKYKDSKYIICPGCKEICSISINNYKINLFNCKNKHCFSNLLLSEMNDFRKLMNQKSNVMNVIKINRRQQIINFANALIVV